MTDFGVSRLKDPFANVASIGIQIGGIGSLAPGKRVLLSATLIGIILG